jgi:hypothetical protein
MQCVRGTLWKGCEEVWTDYFFNIPTHTPIIYTLKSTKFTLKHFKNT